jgi:transposase-like protein
MDNAEPRRRRTHSKQLKSEVVAACAEPWASVAAVALARGLSTILLHKTRRHATSTSGVAFHAASFSTSRQARRSKPKAMSSMITTSTLFYTNLSWDAF